MGKAEFIQKIGRFLRMASPPMANKTEIHHWLRLPPHVPWQVGKCQEVPIFWGVNCRRSYLHSVLSKPKRGYKWSIKFGGLGPCKGIVVNQSCTTHLSIWVRIYIYIYKSASIFNYIISDIYIYKQRETVCAQSTIWLQIEERLIFAKRPMPRRVHIKRTPPKR